MQDVSFRDRTHSLMQGKHRVLTTGPPGIGLPGPCVRDAGFPKKTSDTSGSGLPWWNVQCLFGSATPVESWADVCPLPEVLSATGETLGPTFVLTVLHPELLILLRAAKQRSHFPLLPPCSTHLDLLTCQGIPLPLPAQHRF